MEETSDRGDDTIDRLGGQGGRLRQSGAVIHLVFISLHHPVEGRYRKRQAFLLGRQASRPRGQRPVLARETADLALGKPARSASAPPIRRYVQRIPLARSCRRSPEPTCPGLYIQDASSFSTRSVWFVLFVWFVWSIWSVWFVLFIWLNQTNQIDQMNQRDQTDQTDQNRRRGYHSPVYAVKKSVWRMAQWDIVRSE